MTYRELLDKAVLLLHLNYFEIEDYRPASKLFIEQLEKDIPNAIIIWLKSGEKIVFIDSKK